MASIPLPALHVEAPQQPDTLGNFQKLLAIKNEQTMAPLRQQEAQQNIQAGALDVQAKQREADSSAAIMKAWSDSNGDLGKAYSLAAKSGKATPGDLTKLQQAHIQMQTQALDLLNKQGDRAIQEADLMAGAADAVKKAPPEQRAAVYQQQIQSLASQHVDISQIPPQYPGDQQFATMSLGVQSHKAALEQAVKAAQTAKDTAQAGEATAQTNKLNQEAQYGPTGPAAEAKYRFILNKMKAGTATPEEQSYAKTFEASQTKTTTSSDSLGIKSVNTSGPSGTSMVRGGGGGVRTAGTPAMTPGNSLVDEIGQGKMALNRLDTILTRRPELLQAVTAKYPDFDSSKVKSYAATYESFTHGADAKQVNAGSVAIRHLQELDKLNNDHPVAVRTYGTDAYNRYHNLLDTVADELGTFYGEPKTNEAIASKKATLGALFNRSGAIQEQAKAMGVKFDEMEQKWSNAAPSKAYQAPMPGMSEKAKQARAALDPEYAQTYQPQAAQPKGGGGAVSVTDPNGGVHNFPNQAAADKFKQAAGIK
jgi:hypothetical protein